MFCLCMYVCMYIATQLQSYTLADTCSICTLNAAWVVSVSYIASYLFPYFLCRSLATSLFKTLVYLLFVVYYSILPTYVARYY